MFFEASEHPARPLQPGEAFDAEIAVGEVHAYELSAETGDLVRFTAEQKGGDVEARLFAGTAPVTSMDSPTGAEGAEVVSDVAREATTYRVEIHCADPDAPGPYVLTAERRPAEERDRTQVAAEHDYAQGEALLLNREFPTALERFARAAEGFHEAGSAGSESLARYRVAWMRSQLGQEGWEDAMTEAAQRFADLGDPRMEMRVLNRLGNFLVHDHQTDRARSILEQVRQLAEELDDDRTLAGCLTALGDVYNRLDLPQQAQDNWLAAIELWQRGHDEAAEGSTWLRLGTFYVSLNRLNDAADALERARALTGDAPLTEALVQREIGNLHYRRGEYEMARAALERALEVHDEAEGRRRTRGSILSDLGTVLMAGGLPEAAGERFDAALEIIRGEEDRRGEAMMLHKQGRLAFVFGDLEAALALHDQAEEIFRSVEDLQAATSAGYGAARALHHLDRHREADERLGKVLADAEELRTRRDETELRTAYLDARHHYWQLDVANKMALSELQPENGWEGLALASSERGRARALLELMQAGSASATVGASEGLRVRERELLDRLNRLETTRRNREGERRKRVEERISEVSRELRQVRADMRRSALPAPVPKGIVSKAQKQLRADTLMLVYWLGEAHSFVWALSGSHLVATRLAPRAEIESIAHRAREAFLSAAAEDESLRRAAAADLTRVILEPAWQALAEAGLDHTLYRRLAVVADGALHYVPFAALPETAAGDYDPLLRHFEIVFEPSLAALHAMRQRLSDTRPSRRIALFYDPVYTVDDPRFDKPGQAVEIAPLEPLSRASEDIGLRLRRLPATAREAEGIRHILAVTSEGRSRSFSGFEATREAVLSSNLADYRILHFATHGLIDRTHPELSGLALSQFTRDGQPRNGFLRLADIYGLRLNAELVVLSACESGIGREYRGEGLTGFTHGFLSAGARRLVVSLWNVGDDETADLMQRFYAELAKSMRGSSVSAALRRAQLSLLDETDSSSHRWAAFVFVGDWAGLIDDPIAKAEAGGGEEPPPPEEDDDLPLDEQPTFLDGDRSADPPDEEKP